MDKYKAWSLAKRSQVLKGTRVLGMVWSMKRNQKGITQQIGRQKGGEHYNSSLHTLITNDTTICIMLTLMLMAN